MYTQNYIFYIYIIRKKQYRALIEISYIFTNIVLEHQ